MHKPYQPSTLIPCSTDGLLGARLLADVGFTKRLLQAHNRVLATASLLARAEQPQAPLQQHPLVSSSIACPLI
jgi:hypothetical protein